jgi:hypothetical protein
MKEIARMRLDVLRELKNIRRFFDHMEKSVRSRDEEAIQRAYVYIKTMVYHMNEGDLTPLDVELHKELLIVNRDILD